MMSQAVPHDTTVVPTRAADLVCASYQPRPTVAVCLSGHARTLVQPLVYRTIKGHLVDAFGGDATVVADLKLRDESGEGPLAHVDADEARVRHALAHIGVADRDTIIRATGPPDTVPPCNATTGMVRFSPTTPQKDERGIMVWPTHMGSSRAYYSLLGQLRNRAHCHALIERAEASRGGGRFDVVMVSRPDLVWSFPVRPYCLWNLSQPLRKHDWFYFLPRREMDAALQRPLETMLGCSPCEHSEQQVDVPARLERRVADQLPLHFAGQRLTLLVHSAPLHHVPARVEHRAVRCVQVLVQWLAVPSDPVLLAALDENVEVALAVCEAIASRLHPVAENRQLVRELVALARALVEADLEVLVRDGDAADANKEGRCRAKLAQAEVHDAGTSAYCVLKDLEDCAVRRVPRLRDGSVVL